MASYTIRVHNENGDSKDTRLTASVAAVGRRKTNDLLILHKSVSGRHGELRFDGREVTFVDIGSTNGTFNEDGQRLNNGQPFALMVGEILQLGDIDIELMDVQVDAAPAPAPAAAGGGEMEATAMLSADQIAGLLGDEMGGAAAAPPPASHAPSGRPRQEAAPPPNQRRRREPEPEPPRRRRAPDPEPAPRAPEPEMVPVGGGGGDDWAAAHREEAAAEEEDWAAAAAAGDVGGKKKKKKEKKKKGGGAAGAAGALADIEISTDRPKPQRVSGVLPDENAHLDEGPPGDSIKTFVLGAIMGLIDSFKAWGEQRGGMDEVKDDFRVALGRYKPVLIEASIPIGAVNAAMAVFSILGLFFLGGLFSALNALIGLVGILATAGTYVYFLRQRIGQPITSIEAVMAVVGQWKPFVFTLLWSAAVIIPSAIALVFPAMMVATFVIPIHYIEDRQQFGPVRRTLWIMRNDFKRIFLALICFGVAQSIVMTVFGIFSGSDSTILALIFILLAVPVQTFLSVLMVAYILEVYFDARAALGDGDAEQDVLDNLGDPE